MIYVIYLPTFAQPFYCKKYLKAYRNGIRFLIMNNKYSILINLTSNSDNLRSTFLCK